MIDMKPAMQRAGAQRFRVLDCRTCPLSAYYVAPSLGGGGSYSGSGRRASAPSMSNIYIRDKAREERTLHRLKDLHDDCERMLYHSTCGVHSDETKEDEITEIVSMASSLQDADSQNEDLQATILRLQQRLSQVEDECRSKDDEIKSQQEDNQRLQERLSQVQDELRMERRSNEAEVCAWKQRHSRMQRLNNDLVSKMAAKAFEQKTSHSQTMKEADEWKEKQNSMYDELVQKVGDLATENGELLSKCQQLEKENAKQLEKLALMEEVQAENSGFYQYVEELMGMTNRLNNKLVKSSRAHEESARCYEEELATLREELQLRRQDAASQEFPDMAHRALERENKALRSRVTELETENDNGYRTFEALQREICMLRMALEKPAGKESTRNSLEESVLSTISEDDEKDASDMSEDDGSFRTNEVAELEADDNQAERACNSYNHYVPETHAAVWNEVLFSRLI